MVAAGGDRPLVAGDFPLHRQENDLYREDGTLALEIARRKEQSSQLYANFYQRLGGDATKHERDVFRKLYFLHPEIIHALRHTSPTSEILRAFPKADLHTHLGGVLSAEEIISVALSEKQVAPDPEVQAAISQENMAALRDLRGQCFAGKKEDFRTFYPRLLAFIAAFDGRASLFERLIFDEYLDPFRYHRIGINPYQALGEFQGSSLLQTQNTLTAAVRAYAGQLKSDRVRYVEIRCSPYKYTRLGLTESEVVDIIMDTLDGYHEHFDYRLIVIIGRQAKDSELFQSIGSTLALMESNSRFAGKLAGVDLAGDEGARPPAELRPHFMPFLERCLRVTIHAGETASAENIWEAVYHLSADRIGHGLKLIERPNLLSRFVDKNIGIEMCPSSNDQIVGFREDIYPLGTYMQNGLKVTVNTDNAGISRTSLTNEFLKAAGFCSLSLWECLILIRNSLTTAFLDTASRKRLLLEFENEIHTWCIEHKNSLIECARARAS